MEISSEEKQLGKFHDEWAKDVLTCNIIRETLAIHYGLYRKNVKTLKQAILSMNDYIGELLNLQNKNKSLILDAGCGLGGTSIHLAKKYPNSYFSGITISPSQVVLASNFSNEREVYNTSFSHQNFLKTNFPDNNFDGIFSLESFSYAKDKDKFIKEMHRILKPGGRLVVVDVFRTPNSLNPFMQTLYNRYCYEFGNVRHISLNKYTNLLKGYNFSEILIEDITKNVRKSIFQWGFISAMEYIAINCKSKIPIINKPKNEKTSEIHGNTFLGGIIGLMGALGYYGTSFIK